MIRALLSAGLLLLPALAGAQAEAPYRLGPEPPPHPQRVVSVAPNLTETVLALGAEGRLVGVSRFDDDPRVAGLPRIGGYLDPNLEAILALNPDLVLVEPSPGNREVVEKLAALGVPIRVAPARSIAGVSAMILALGDDLGLQPIARRLDGRLTRGLEQIRAAAKGLARPRTLLVYGHEPLVVAGPGTFGHELLALAGGKNVVPPSGIPYPTLPLEQVIALDPELIVDLVIHGDRTPRTGPFERLTTLRAVREGRVVRLTSERLMRPSPGLAEAVRELFAVLHPEARLPPR